MMQPIRGNETPIIDIGRVEKIYHLGKENVVRALDGVDLKIYRNEYVAIMGPTCWVVWIPRPPDNIISGGRTWPG